MNATKKYTRLIAPLFMLVLIGGCAPAPSAEIKAATASLPAGVISLKSGDASGLVGKWTGGYVMQDGFRGRSHLTLTQTSATTVDGVFEYFWGNGNYHRSPEDGGGHEGVIKADGELHFDTWNMKLERDGARLTLTATEDAFGGRASFTWRKDGSPLPSEVAAGS